MGSAWKLARADSWQLFEALHAAGREEGAHLGDGDFVEFEQTLRCGQALADKHGVETLQIGEDPESVK